MNRFFTRQELATEYRLPKHIMEQLLAQVSIAAWNGAIFAG